METRFPELEPGKEFEDIAENFDKFLRAELEERNELSDWGSREAASYQKSPPPWFVLDIEEDRFNWKENKIDNIVVTPEIDVDAVMGNGSLVDARLESSHRHHLNTVLGYGTVERHTDLDQNYTMLDTPQTYVDLVDAASENDVDFYRPVISDIIIERADPADSAYPSEVVEKAREGFDEWVDAELIDAGADPDEVAVKSRELEGNTSIITRKNEYIDAVNEYNDGTLAYHTPGLARYSIENQAD